MQESRKRKVALLKLHHIQTTRIVSIKRDTTQDFVFENGRVSLISTRSPSLYALASSCAWYFFARTTYFPYRGCFTRRFTSTATVLFLLLLTTSPTKVRLIDGGISFILLSIADCLLGQYRLHPCNRTARFFQLTGICQLLSRQLHTQAHTCFNRADNSAFSAARSFARNSVVFIILRIQLEHFSVRLPKEREATQGKPLKNALSP